MDSAYWDVTSLEGNNYTVCAVDSCTAYHGGFHCELRSDVTLAVGKYVVTNHGKSKGLELLNPQHPIAMKLAMVGTHHKFGGCGD